ncbi:MAG: hypothetical protein EPO21_15610 [Chloroflexota bacterium]|nr:MAG: hypothetical protein EPO21_15610 [Chloroflexota bacterium]
MSPVGRTAFVNFTLVMSSLAFLSVVAVAYFSGASFSTMVLRGLMALVGVGGLGWLVLKLLAVYPQARRLSQHGEMEQSDRQRACIGNVLDG